MLRTVRGGYMLDVEPDQVDVHQFEERVSSAGARLEHPSKADAESALDELHAALDLWRGEPLQDAKYEPFVLAEIEHLHELRAVALEYEVEARLLLGRHEQAIPALRQLIAEYPMRERLRAQLMLALYRSGRQADTLRAFDAARELLVDELGVEPGRDLQRLQRAVLGQDAELDWIPLDERFAAGAARPEIPKVSQLEETLLERDRELTAISEALAEAQQGRGQVVLLDAPAGLGKTSLLQAATTMAADAGFTVHRARASELEHDFAYGCVRQMLEPVVAKSSDATRDRLFEGAAALSKPLFAAAGAPLLSPSDDSSFSILHGLYWLLNNLAAGGPMLLSIDDLHWSDTESLRFVNYLAPRLDGLPVALFASARTGEHVTPELAHLVAGPEITVLRLAPLGIAATAAMCEHMLGASVAPDFAAACRDATGGNPLFLEALLREAKEQQFSTGARDALRVERVGPAAVAQSVLLRLSVAPAAASALIRALAVLGDGASLTETARLAGVADHDADRAADLLVTLAVLKPAAALEFAHPIVREAVYADIGARERSTEHTRAAEILSEIGASEERIAAQIVGAEPAGDPERVDLLRRVAGDALAGGAPAAAVAWLRRALAEPPTPASRSEVLFELGAAEYRNGSPESVEHLAAAVDAAADPELLASAARWLGLALTMSGDSDRAVDAIEAAIAVVEPADRERALVLEAELAAHAQEAGVERRAPAAKRLERYADLAGSTPGERLVQASLAFERARASESEGAAVQHIERALAGGRLIGEQEIDVAGPFYLLMVGLLATDALDLADECLAQAFADARARESIPPLAFVIEFRGWVALRRGAIARAEADRAYGARDAHRQRHPARKCLRTRSADRSADRGWRGRCGRGNAARQRLSRGHTAGPREQRPARSQRLAPTGTGAGARRRRRPDRVRPPRRAVGRREPARIALALAGGARSRYDRRPRECPRDGARRPRAGPALGIRLRHRHRAPRERTGRERRRVGGSPS